MSSSTSSSNQAMASTVQPLKLCKNSDDGDRISNLPEPLLLHILSFLSTKQAATTSVLSKPWKSLWTLVPDLDIVDSDMDNSDDSDDTGFYRMVFKIFVSRRAPSIRKFRLECFNFNCEHIDASFILSLAVELKVEELDFWFKDCSTPFDLLPPTLFHCNTLVVLKLNLVCFKGSSFHLPSLKILRLEEAEYEDEGTFRSLLSGCPVLDEFVMFYDSVSFDTSFHFEISSLTVRTVTMDLPPPSKITVNAPALEYLSIDIGVPDHVLVLNDVPSSMRASFRISGIEAKCDYQDTVKGFLGALCNVQFLELKTISGLLHDQNIPIDVFPRFDYLVELKVESYYNRCALPLVVKMLLNCSRLEHLILVSTTALKCEKTQCWISPRHVPNCLAFHLTTIKVERFKALEAEMEFIEYVLNNSKVLRNMTICNRPGMDSKRMSDAFLKISTFEKQSTRCKLNFQQLP